MNRGTLPEVNYYFITDERLEMPPEEQVELALEAGVKMVQYRAKSKSGKEMYREASAIAEKCSERALFIVNDRLDIALAVDADGVHLGQDDIPPEAARELLGDKILGISTHSLEQAEDAEKLADYIGVGPVHSTDTKEKVSEELGIHGTITIAESVDVPTAAIGGITMDDLEPLAGSLDMVCAISSVTQKGEIYKNIREFETRFKELKRSRE